MVLQVNGEEHEIPEGSTVAQLLDLLGVVRERVAVEVNLHVVRRADHGAHVLGAGDQVEVVAFVGGG
ncbi:sulfur carrier protein ThiS [Vulgatibacter incomptus]|uniref:sulfur carrier protein ThiS n=1 Tax=Vulgatibacter incomptus TaxID=1391653 RepID=UPI00067FA002|nr:sulfur carrier protein ThiS [Vulgatibacter incomptus]